MNDDLAQELVHIAAKWYENYPKDIFPPLSGKDNDELNDMLKHNGWSRDQISADMMRRAAGLLVWEAEQLTKDDQDD